MKKAFYHDEDGDDDVGGDGDDYVLQPHSSQCSAKGGPVGACGRIPATR